MAIILLKEII